MPTIQKDPCSPGWLLRADNGRCQVFPTEEDARTAMGPADKVAPPAELASAPTKLEAPKPSAKYAGDKPKRKPGPKRKCP